MQLIRKMSYFHRKRLGFRVPNTQRVFKIVTAT